jgi:hypothetical protein
MPSKWTGIHRGAAGGSGGQRGKSPGRDRHHAPGRAATPTTGVTASQGADPWGPSGGPRAAAVSCRPARLRRAPHAPRRAPLPSHPMHPAPPPPGERSHRKTPDTCQDRRATRPSTPRGPAGQRGQAARRPPVAEEGTLIRVRGRWSPALVARAAHNSSLIRRRCRDWRRQPGAAGARSAAAGPALLYSRPAAAAVAAAAAPRRLVDAPAPFSPSASTLGPPPQAAVCRGRAAPRRPGWLARPAGPGAAATGWSLRTGRPQHARVRRPAVGRVRSNVEHAAVGKLVLWRVEGWAGGQMSAGRIRTRIAAAQPAPAGPRRPPPACQTPPPLQRTWIVSSGRGRSPPLPRLDSLPESGMSSISLPRKAARWAR